MKKSVGWSIGFLAFLIIIAIEPFVSDLICLANGWERTIPEGGWLRYLIEAALIVFLFTVVNWYHFKLNDVTDGKKAEKNEQGGKERYVWGTVVVIVLVGLRYLSGLRI